ncbi:MAG TPA: helix-turn-helix transcriptional regulator [Bryobacteraceae bacterium]|jgi:ribosome-binding protein aMBF1 (putative translation factor)
MIRSENEYQEASKRLAEERQRLTEHRRRLEKSGLADDEIKRVVDPMESFHLQLQEEVESYERLKRGEFDEIYNLRGLGHLLIALRIAQGISQRELAKRTGVHESQVSRDERNEYFGVTLERAGKILDALNVHLQTKVAIAPRPPMVAA